MSHLFKGVITALVTPFRNGEVDYQSFRRLVSAQLDGGIDGFVVNGTTGESPTLTHHEVEKLFEVAQTEAGGKVPILVGTGVNCTRKTIALTQEAAKWGASGALVVTPYYNKPPQRGLIAHFTAVADASSIPIVLYNVPGRTITSIDPETAVALSRHPKIAGIKEASGDLGYLAKITSQVPKDFVLLSGDDATAPAFCAQGGHGVISVVSHVIPTEMKAILEMAGRGDPAADQQYRKYADLLKLIYIESNPIPIKAAVYLMGLIETLEMRLPLVPLVDPQLSQLRTELRRLKKLEG